MKLIILFPAYPSIHFPSRSRAENTQDERRKKIFCLPTACLSPFSVSSNGDPNRNKVKIGEKRVRVYFFIFIIFNTFNLIHSFSYDSAIYTAQKGNWKDAHAALNSMITHNPDSADVIYDAGVTAYNLGNHCQAATCFMRAAHCGADNDICFRGHFNAGNAYVDQKNLKSALEQYDKALAIEPDNEYARHNRD